MSCHLSPEPQSSILHLNIFKMFKKYFELNVAKAELCSPFQCTAPQCTQLPKSQARYYLMFFPLTYLMSKSSVLLLAFSTKHGQNHPHLSISIVPTLPKTPFSPSWIIPWLVLLAVYPLPSP